MSRTEISRMSRSNIEGMKHYIIGITFFLLSIQIGFGQESYLQSADHAKALSVSVMEDFFRAQFSSSFENMKNYMPVSNEEVSSLELKTQKFFKIIHLEYGQPNDFVKVYEKKLGEVAFKEVFFIRFDKHPIIVTFIYYHNGKGWILSSFKWNDSLSTEFED